MNKKIGIAISLIIIGICYCYIIRPVTEREFFYPVKYKAIVSKEAAKNNVDPSLVAAVILAESKYRPEAESEPGAKGLMQVMPTTADWIQEEHGENHLEGDELHNPEKNIALGTWYLGHLLEEYKGNEILALAAYNAGSSYVNSWMEDYNWTDDFDDISKIPFLETRAYVKKVLEYEKQYKELYR